MKNATFFNNTNKLSPTILANSYNELNINDSHFEAN